MKLYSILPQKSYLLTPDAVWDGLSSTTQKGLAICISGGIISQVVPVSRITGSEFSHAEKISLKGITLMPGLIDCHVHLAMDSKDLWKAVEEWTTRPESIQHRIAEDLQNYLASGVLAVRDGGDKASLGLKARNLMRAGQTTGPWIIAAGRAIFKKGKYGSFLGPGIDTVKEAMAQIDELKRDGIDQLKVINSGIVSFKQFGTVGAPQFTIDELTRIVEKAHTAGLKVMTHASSQEAVEIAAMAGVDSVEHGYFLETRQLELMARQGTAWVPTLAPLGNLLTTGKAPYDGADLEIIRKSFEIQLKRVKEAHDLGVRLGIGTDAGANNVPHGFSYHDELSFFSRAGLSLLAILGLATGQSAAILGLENRIGSIKPGMEPYLLGVGGDPLQSLDVLKGPELVFMPGR